MLNLNSILTRAKDLKIAVIGDLVEDIYIYGDVNRISPEAPIPIVDYYTTKRTMGGAGNVFMNILNLCPKAELFCFFENFKSGYLLWPTWSINHHSSSHSKKTRIVSGTQQMLRIDNDCRPLPPYKLEGIDWNKDLRNRFKEFNAFVLSDYNKGVLQSDLIESVITESSHYHIPVIVDAKDRYTRYNGATIIKGNEKEWDKYDLRPSQFAEVYNVETVVKTCGHRGISWYDKTSLHGLDGIEATIVDVCGAGDTVTAILAIMRALGEPIHDACELANIAAAEVCKYSGVTPIDEEKLITAYKNYESHRA